jgi:HSP20 family protein
MIVRQVGPWTLGWPPPAAAFAQMRREMESLMERLGEVAADGSTAGVFPPMNISEDRDQYHVRALIPGIDPARLDVSVVNQTLTVSGVRQAPQEEGVSYHRKERPGGAFRRSVTLPAPFDGTRVGAKYVDGVLTLTLPKPEAAKPRRVRVETA